MEFRPGTMDEYIYTQVVGRNEYNLPRRLGETAPIIDIGGHIGSFAIACWYRGSRNIHIFEADIGNYHQILKNTKGMDGIHAYNFAVWRSDRVGEVLRHTGYTDVTASISNTGGGNVFWTDSINTGIEIPTISLDEIIKSVTDFYDNPTVQYLKIDAETSEFPILLTSQLVTEVDRIVGEFHEVGGEYNSNYIPEHAKVDGVDAFTIEVLSGNLKEKGFRTTYVRSGDTNLGYFSSIKVRTPYLDY